MARCAKLPARLSGWAGLRHINEANMQSLKMIVEVLDLQRRF
jgi:hypothetical protein